MRDRMQWVLVAVLVLGVAAAVTVFLLNREPEPEVQPPASSPGDTTATVGVDETDTVPDPDTVLPDMPPDGVALEEATEPLPNTIVFLEAAVVSDPSVSYRADFQTHSIGPGDESDRTVIVVFSDFAPTGYVEQEAELTGRAAVLHVPESLHERITTVGQYSGIISLRESDGFYILVLSELDN